MQVRYEVRDSLGMGKGVFTLQDIPKGTLVWKRTDGENAIARNEKASKEYCKTSDEEVRNRFLDVAYGDGNYLVFTWDDSQYFNHNDNK